MILGLLAGNTSLRFGLHDGREVVSTGRIEWTELKTRAGELSSLARSAWSAVAGSVRDDLLERARPFLQPELWPPRLARRDFAIPIENRYERPDEVGTDRLLNALALRDRAQGRAAVAVDFGTAVSLSAVSRDGAFIGGAIASGSRALLRGLREAAPLLPIVEPAVPGGYVQRRTADAIRCGVFWQVAGGVRVLLQGMIAELCGRTGGTERLLVLATGGEAGLFAPSIPEIEAVDPDLTLRGLFAACRRSG